MLTPKIQEALNNQVQMEMSSAYAYLAMTGWFERANLPGFANWMRVQAQEEVTHAMRLFDYIHDRDGKVTLLPIGQPAGDFSSAIEVMENALGHEQKVTASINAIHKLSVDENDPATQVEMQWFINEQVEEEKNANDLLERVRQVADYAPAMFMLDNQIAGRVLEDEAGA